MNNETRPYAKIENTNTDARHRTAYGIIWQKQQYTMISARKWLVECLVFIKRMFFFVVPLCNTLLLRISHCSCRLIRMKWFTLLAFRCCARISDLTQWRSSITNVACLSSWWVLCESLCASPPQFLHRVTATLEHSDSDLERDISVLCRLTVDSVVLNEEAF